MSTATHGPADGTPPTDPDDAEVVRGDVAGAPDDVTVAPDEAVPPAPVAVGSPSAVAVSILLCLLLVGLGVVLLRELLVGREVAGTVLVPGGQWLGPSLGSATSVVQGDLAALAGVAGMVLGVLLVAAAVASRPPRSVRLGSSDRSDVPVDLDHHGVAALAADAALQDPEVGTSRASAGRRRVQVDVSVDPRDAHDEAALAADLSRRVSERLQDLEHRPRVQVRVHGAVPR